MVATRLLLVGLLVATAIALQTAVVVRLELPYGRPDLILLVVVALGLAAGPRAGMWIGFSAGLLTDLLADHPAGIFALVLCLVGYGAGLLPDAPKPSVLLPVAAVAVAAVAAGLGYAVLLAILGSPRLDWRVVIGSMPGSVAYDVVLAVFIVPAVFAVYRRLDPRERGPR